MPAPKQFLPRTLPVRFPFMRKAALHAHVGLKSEGERKEPGANGRRGLCLPRTLPVRFPFIRKAALHAHVGLKSEGERKEPGANGRKGH
jgi:hypothetical protein